MRIARFGLVALLAACASGKAPEVVDASVGGGDDGPPADADCGEFGCVAVYVAKSGNDQAPGTKDAPLRTVQAGVNKAALISPPAPVFVQAGVYQEQLKMKAGVTVVGGFDPSWTHSDSVTTQIEGPSPVVAFDKIMTTTAVDSVTIHAFDAVTTGESSIAVVVTGSKMVELRNVTIDPGVGGPGADGLDGGNGANGNAGTAGGPGVEHSTATFCDNHTLPAGGAGGTSSCGRTGGRGGDPGVGGSGGGAGLSGIGGTPGGAGAPGESQNGSVGGNGSSGGAGNSGAPGSEVGMFAGAMYLPANGANGAAGMHGDGGGGGGGGGGGTTDCDSSGSSGGGGGAGGCGGAAGTGGTGGGGSFGIILVDSIVTVRASMVVANHGGPGGRGGKGGLGGTGGLGGAGGPYGGSSEQDDGGFGAAGGRGGNGGSGGHGGGGGGGPSAAAVCVGTATLMIPQTTLVGGTGGAGGPSMGNTGATGTSSKAIGCSFF